MRKTVTAAAMAASLTIGGATGAVLFAPTSSGAQDDPTTEEPSGEGSVERDGFPNEARPDGGFRHRRFPFGAALTEVLGIDAAALRDALADGQTIAEVAESNDVAVQDVIDALVAEAEERITALVNGDLDRGELGRRGHRFGPTEDTPGS